MNTMMRRLGMVLLVAISLLVLTANVQAAEVIHTKTRWPTRSFAPYSFDYANQTDLVALAQKTGTRFFSLAFIINRQGQVCQASWNGVHAIGSWMQSRISDLQGLGGDVSISFGGASGKEIADSCSTVQSLEAQYQSVITTYNLTHVDFDIEGKTLSNTQGNNLRNQAIAALQASDPHLIVSYTLPVGVTGLPDAAMSLLQNAIQNGVNVNVVNIMTMDYYNKNAPGNQMGENAIKAANSVFQQLHALYPSKSSSELWAMVGITPMIGMNDDHKEVFTLKDARMVLSFAEQQQISLLAFWDVQRDHQCRGHQKPPNDCTGVMQKPYEYDQIFAAFTVGLQ